MKTGLLLALLGKALTMVGTDAPSQLAASSPSLLMLVGLGGLALLTLRSERWRAAEQAASAAA